MSKRKEIREKFINCLIESKKSVLTFEQIKNICVKNKIPHPHWFLNDADNRVKRGVYKVPLYTNDTEVTEQIEMKSSVVPFSSEVNKVMNKISNVSTQLDEIDLIPPVYENYVPFGNFEDILSIVKSKSFFPVFITGHSGNGKTMSIEQACAKAKRKFVCVSMTPETDESDLLGNYVLINGNMEWRDGPVTTAARQGSVLCIDEIDYGTQNLSCLQRVLEGKPFLLKKKGELIVPQHGFTIFATANTKGKGSDDGRYMFTNILNEAFLERFNVTMEQYWPPKKVELKIISKELDSLQKSDDIFSEKLIDWADIIRKTFDDGGCDEVISTRRLTQIVKAYKIFDNKMKAIEFCLNRFDEDTKSSFLDLYTKVDAGVSKQEISSVDIPPTTENVPKW